MGGQAGGSRSTSLRVSAYSGGGGNGIGHLGNSPGSSPVVRSVSMAGGIDDALFALKGKGGGGGGGSVRRRFASLKVKCSWVVQYMFYCCFVAGEVEEGKGGEGVKLKLFFKCE